MTNLEIMRMAIRASLFRPYYWGGSEPVRSWDCSGWVQEILWSAGVIVDYEDRTAAGQLDYWKSRGKFIKALPEFTSRATSDELEAPESVEGWLVFFKRNNSEKIIEKIKTE